MQENLYDNMIKVLAYFADQCDMFTPMLDGVKELKEENANLRKEVEVTRVLQNRMQLNATFNADYANFGIQTVKQASEDADKVLEYNILQRNTKNTENDLYILIKSVISVGRDNYIREDMEYILDFYNMTGLLDIEKYMELFMLIDDQYTEEVSNQK